MVIYILYILYIHIFTIFHIILFKLSAESKLFDVANSLVFFSLNILLVFRLE